MDQYDEQSKHNLLNRNSEYSDDLPYHVAPELYKGPGSSWGNHLSLAIFCLMLYVAVLETAFIVRQPMCQDNASRLFEDGQPSKVLARSAIT